MPFIISEPGAITGHTVAVDREVLIRKLRRMVTGTRELDDDRPPCVGTGNGTILFDLIDPASPAQTWTATFRIGTTDWEIEGTTDGIVGVVNSDTTFNNDGTADPVSLRITTGSVAFVNNDVFTIVTSNNVIDDTDAERWNLDLTSGAFDFDASEFHIRRHADTSQAIRMIAHEEATADHLSILFQMAINYTGGGTGTFGSTWEDDNYHFTWSHTHRYYIVSNARRIIFVTEFAGKYFSSYVGLFLPFATVGQYPNPMFVGTGAMGMDKMNWKFHDNVRTPGAPEPQAVGDDAPLPRGGRIGGFYNNKYGGRWYDETDTIRFLHGKPSCMSENASQNSNGHRVHMELHVDFDIFAGIWPWSGIDEGFNMTRATTGAHMAIQSGSPTTTHGPPNEMMLSDDGYMLMPAILFRDTSISGGIANVLGDVLGQMDGMYWVSGWRNLPENRGTFDGTDYVCFPDPTRPGILAGWWALRLE